MNAATFIAKFAAAHPAEARRLFEDMIKAAIAAGDTKRADDLRLQCEYHCDPAFRAAMSNEVARINGVN